MIFYRRKLFPGRHFSSLLFQLRIKFKYKFMTKNPKILKILVKIN